MLGSIQITRENLTGVDVAEIAVSLRNHEVSLLLLRECTITDADFEKLANGLAQCRSIVQLTLNIGIVCNMQRIAILTRVLQLNKSLRRLHLHGSPLGNDGLACLMPGLLVHPTLTDFDVGDCQLGDDAIRDIAMLIIEREKRKHPITILTLSANQDVTAKGWTSLISAVATAKYLQGLFIDYTRQGDYGAGIIAVMLASNRSLQQLDLEDTGISDNGAELILHSLYSFPTSISNFILDENDIQEEILSEIDSCLNQDREEASTVDNDVDDEDDDDDDVPSSNGNVTTSMDLRGAVRFAHSQNEDQSDESDNKSSVNHSYNDTFPSFIQSKPISESEDEDRIRIASKLRLIQKDNNQSDDSSVRNRHRSSTNESRDRQRRHKQLNRAREVSSESDQDDSNSKRVEAQVHYDSGVTESLHRDNDQNQRASIDDDTNYQNNGDNDDEIQNNNVNQEIDDDQESNNSSNIGQSNENRSVHEVESSDQPANQEIQSNDDNDDNDGKKSVKEENNSANNDNRGDNSDSSKSSNKRRKARGVEISSDDDDDDNNDVIQK